MGLFGKGSEETATLKIEGMSCGHCVMRVEKGVGAMPGVKAAKIDLAKKEGTFTFDAQVVKADDIRKKIVDLGYKA
jgi:copper ion binding protein